MQDKPVNPRPTRRHAVLWWALTLLWCGVIFVLTAGPSFTAEATRHVVQEAAPSVSAAPPAPATVDEANFAIRKLAHVAVYAVFGGLALMAIRAWPAPRWPGWAGWGFSTLYAASDEIHQLYVPGRTGMVRDVLLDSVAAALAIFVVTAFLGRHSRRQVE